jgi:hypothetical protein
MFKSKCEFLLEKKNKYLQEIRQEIKKKRIVFDENKERFGLDEFTQLVKVKNTTEIKGYPFQGYNEKYTKTRGIKFGIKILPIETKYEKKEHPSNLENLILKELTDNIVNKDISPHIVYYLGTQKVSNKSRALKQLNLKRLENEKKIRSHSNILISEFIEGGSLDNWVYNIYENDKEITNLQWKNIVFQLIYTIAVIQKYYKMMHNDFHYGNILIDDSITPGGYFVYEIDNKTYYIKNEIGIIPKLWDFEFSMVYSNKMKDCYPNKFIIGPYNYDRKTHTTIYDSTLKTSDSDSDSDDDLNVPFNYNEVYDLHYFLTSLLDLYISQELFDWIINLYPRELIPDDDSSCDSESENESCSESEGKTSTSLSTISSACSIKKTICDIEKLKIERHDKDTQTEPSNSTYQSEDDYLCDGRLINGVETQFKLPTPFSILNHEFFKEFTKKPDDFDEYTAMYFKAGF